MANRIETWPNVVRLAATWALVSAAVMLWMSPSAAAEPATTKPEPTSKADDSALDDDLLKDLENELLEDVGELKRRPVKQSPSDKPEKKGASPQPGTTGEEVSGPSAEQDPLSYISEQMRSAEELIPERSKRTSAEVLQKRIVEDLARLIEQAEQQRAAQQSSASKDKKQQSSQRQSVQQSKPSSTGSSGKDSNRPAQDSTDRLGKDEEARPDAELVKGMMKDTWGHLPEKAREQMLQNSPEKFVPQYELLIERYYKRLAEERTSR